MFYSRNYSGLEDLEKLKDILMAQRATGATGYMHVGDLLWGMFMHTQMNPARDHRIWFAEDGSVAGFVRLTPPAEFEMQVAAHLRGQLEPDMLAWTRAHYAGANPIKLTSVTMESETKTQAWLLANGFRRNDFEMFILTCDVRTAQPPPALAGAAIRPVAGEEEFAERVSIHREVWEPSKVTLDGYRLTRAAPGYDPELDLALALDTGEFAAYCIMWVDPVNKIAEFEPVGTRKAYRGRGYGTTLLLDGFLRLRMKGMNTALVYCYAHNVPFYTSAGFEVVDKYIGFEG